MSVLPESAGEPVVLTGEPPDATRIPAGCRFHPRCPELANGAAAAAGVDGQCRTVALPVLPAAAPDGHSMAACHLADVTPEPDDVP
jgi:peptide/nickel transport system ATP-binding protein